MDLHHPLFQSVVLPLATAALLAWALRAAGAARIAPQAALAALVLSAWLILGAETTAPLSATTKLPWVFASCLAAGLAGAALRMPWRQLAAAGAALLAILGLWLAWPLIGTVRGAGSVSLAGFWLVAAAVLAVASLGADSARAGHGASPLAALVVGCLGLAGVAFQSGSLVLFQLALALAAAVGGIAVWNWPVVRDRLDVAATGAPLLAAMLLALATWLLAAASPLALWALACVVAALPLARRVQAASRIRYAAIEPLLVAAFAVVPVLAALWLAAPGAAGGPYYR